VNSIPSEFSKSALVPALPIMEKGERMSTASLKSGSFTISLLLVASCATVFVGTEGSPVLKRDVTGLVMLLDAATDKRCTQHKVEKTELVEVREAPRMGIERWTVDRCGELVNYRVTLTPASQGGTLIKVEREP
jgi:hypothetical protein